MNAPVTVRINPTLAAEAQKVAQLDGVSLDRLVEAVLQRHVEFIGHAERMTASPDELRNNFVLRRSPDETDEEYAERNRLLLG